MCSILNSGAGLSGSACCLMQDIVSWKSVPSMCVMVLLFVCLAVLGSSFFVLRLSAVTGLSSLAV